MSVIIASCDFLLKTNYSYQFMSEWIPVIGTLVGTLAGAFVGFFASNYQQSRSRKFQREDEYRRELRKHMDRIITPLFSLLQDLWGSLAQINEAIIHKRSRVLPQTRELMIKDAIEKNQKLQNFVSENYDTFSLIFPSPFPWIFIPLNNLIIGRILDPMLHPEIPEIFNDDLDFKKDCTNAINTLMRIQKDLRKLVGYEIDIELETKYPFQ